MKKNNIHKLLFPFALLLALVSVFSFSCRKKTDCNVKINVIDGNTSAPVSGTTVHIYPPTGNLQTQDQTSATDASGVVSFTFKLEATLQVDVAPPAPYTVPPSETIDLDPGEEVSKTIKVY